MTRTDGKYFFVAGINYKKCDTAIRGQYALNNEMAGTVLQDAKAIGLQEVFILSTCNRTEIYGLAHSADTLIELLCRRTAGDIASFRKSAYIKKNQKAVEHLYEVAAGLDSQILGDYEIVGQIKTAVRISREMNMSGTYLDRLISSVLQASKEIKNRTQLSGGTVSVSFAAVQMIRNSYEDLSGKQILVLGTGKIGTNTCKNLVDYTAPRKITLMNRSPEKARVLAKKFNLEYSPIENLAAELAMADIIITATNAPQPVILREHLEGKGEKLIIDLSVPLNVADDVPELTDVKVILVDELSKMKDETLSRRKADIPRAKEIIAEHISEFLAWHEKRKHAPMLSYLKTTLHHLHRDPGYPVGNSFCAQTASTRIKKVLSDTAKDLEIHDRKGCQFISAINQFMN